MFRLRPTNTVNHNITIVTNTKLFTKIGQVFITRINFDVAKALIILDKIRGGQPGYNL